MYTINMKSVKNKVRKIYIKKIYKNIIILAILLHLFFSVFFSITDIKYLMYYNILSSLFYIFMIFLVNKRMFKVIVSLVHLEVILFVTISIYYLGWDTGYSFYLIAMASLIYFCPFKYKFIPYLFGIAEALLFIIIRIYMNNHDPIYVCSDQFYFHMYLLNCICCFVIILYAAYLFGLSTDLVTHTLESENTILNKAAYYDQLTGAYTRYHFLKTLKNLNFDTFGIAIFDLDDFKLINDTYGHNCGDYILNEMVNIIRKNHHYDINITRWGGEEFIILFTTPIEKKDIFNELEIIRKTIENNNFIFEKNLIKITITLGACIANKNDDIYDIIKRIDDNLYKGKSNGKNCVILE